MKLFIDPESVEEAIRGKPGMAAEAHECVRRRAELLPGTSIPDVKPRVIQRFEPWMALSFTEGSIGGDIERMNLNQLQAFYGAPPSHLRRRASRRSLRDRTASPSRLRIPLAATRCC